MVEGGGSEELFVVKGPLGTFNLYTIRVFRERVFQLVVGLTGVPLDAHPEYTGPPGTINGNVPRFTHDTPQGGE